MAKKPRVQFNKTPAEILQERRAKAAANANGMARIKQPRQPLGGAPEVKIPPLDAQLIEGGGTMQEQAEILQDPASPLSPAYNPQLADMHAQQKFAALPPSAREQPGFMPGVGSMIAGNQPFIGERGQQTPQAGYKPKLSDATKQGLQALGDFHQQAAQAQQQAAQPQQRAQRPPLPPASPPDEGLDEDLEATRQEIEDMLQQSQEFNVFNDPERRKRIEANLEPMDVTEIIVHGELRQTIPLLDKLSITLRTVTGEEDLEVKRMMYGEKGGELYMMEKYNTLQLALGLVAVNEQELPTHLGKEGLFDLELFNAKYRKVIRFPVQLLADFCVQYTWFDERVRGMLAGQTEALKNT